MWRKSGMWLYIIKSISRHNPFRPVSRFHIFIYICSMEWKVIGNFNTLSILVSNINVTSNNNPLKCSTNHQGHSM